jgi:cyclic peptide transporter
MRHCKNKVSILFVGIKKKSNIVQGENIVNKKKFPEVNFILMLLFIFILIPPLYSYTNADKKDKGPAFTEIAEKVRQLKEEGNIPGLSLLIIKEEDPEIIKGFGYANVERKAVVTPDTLFEPGSCSKSFTALAALKLEKEGLLNLDHPVSRYLPWFYMTYKKKNCKITLRQLLHHTSGIPWNTIQKIPGGDDANALEQTVKNIIGVELDHRPGTHYQYATINYDIIGLIIEKASGMTYKDYMDKHVLEPLGLSAATVGMARVDPAVTGGTLDRAASIIFIILCLFILVTAAYIISIVIDLIKARRHFAPLTRQKAGKIVAAILAAAPFLLGIYLLPRAIANISSWELAFIWSPVSFKAAVILLLAAFAAGYLGFILSVIFPQKNKYLKAIPLLLLLSILSGGANAVIIFLISGSLFVRTGLIYMLYYFGLAMGLYLLGRKVVQTKLTKLTFNIVYDLRMKLTENIFYTSFQKFEKLDRGRVLATLNGDTGQLGGSTNVIVRLLTGLVTIFGVFLYLFTIAFWATLVTLGIVAAIAILYFIVSQKAQVYLEEARDTRDVYMHLLNGLIYGFKELSIHINKKREYKDDVEKICDIYRKKITKGMVKFINAFMIGESMLVAVLGAVAFTIPRLFPEIRNFTLMSFIIALLYLIGPINIILNLIPEVMQMRVAWNRVKGFMKDIPANMNSRDLEKLKMNIKDVKCIEANGVIFQYESKDEDKPFTVGPIDFKARKGEIIFIVGGNGGGKTTLAKLLTGLYIPDKGTIKIDGKEVTNYQLGEYYSTVFSDYHLFEKLYNIDISNTNKREKAENYLELFRLKDKVSFEANSFSTIELSGGQRKRLALLQCYLEDCPIFLFDELAADQDPEFKRFFYRGLLLQMKEKGKIVIAITHDDNYFDVADKIIKMDMGKIQTMESLTGHLFTEKRPAVTEANPVH